jgi:FkbM family methyltransferase
MKAIARKIWRSFTPYRLRFGRRLDVFLSDLGSSPAIHRIQGGLARRTGRVGGYSQWGEDLWLAPILDPARDGWIVDVGANDGIRGSNSRRFILQGFRAVCVEPDPRPLARLKKLYANDPAVTVVGAAAGAEDGEAVFHLGQDPQHSSLGPAASPLNRNPLQEVTVPVRPLDSILEEAGVDRIALLSIDVEGFEWPALSGLDLARWRPRCVVVETHTTEVDHVNERIGEILGLFRKHGYRLAAATTSNSVFLAPGAPEPPTPAAPIPDLIAAHANASGATTA